MSVLHDYFRSVKVTITKFHSVDSKLQVQRKKLLKRAIKKRRKLSDSPETNLRIYALLGATIRKTPKSTDVTIVSKKVVHLGPLLSDVDQSRLLRKPSESCSVRDDDSDKDSDCSVSDSDPLGIGAFLLTVKQSKKSRSQSTSCG